MSVPPPGSSGWKEPKSGWNESPPRSQQTTQPVQKIHATPKVTLTRVQSELAPPPVIKRDYSNMPKMPQIVPIVHQYPNHPPPIPSGPPPVIHRVYNAPPPVVPFQHIQPKTKVILKREFDSDSEGKTTFLNEVFFIKLKKGQHHHPQETLISPNFMRVILNFGKVL